MNKTLIIYDLDGRIISNPITGNYQIPNGVPYIEAIIPNGKYVVSVNTETKEPIFSDLPKSEMAALEDKLSTLEQSIANVEYTLMMGGVM